MSSLIEKERHRYIVPWMTRFLVKVKLEILIVYKEATTFFVNGEMSIIALSQQIHVIAMCQLSFCFNRLIVYVRSTQRMNVRPISLLTSFTQASLHFWPIRLQVMMNHIKVLEIRKFAVRR